MKTSDLKVFQKSHELTLNIYRVTERFPREEKFGLTSQMRRSSSSIPMNIIEGSGRNSLGEYIHFLGIALGSCREIEYQIFLAKDLKLISEKEYVLFRSDCDEIGRMIYGLIKRLKSKVK